MKKIIAVALFLAPIAAHADDVKKLSGVDLSVQTHKWDGKTIETTGYCFYADTDEFRCHAGGIGNGVRMDFSKIEPESARKKIEDNCDTIPKMFTKTCAVRFQFVYDGFDTMPNGSGGEIRLVVAKDGLATVVGK